MPRLLGLRPMLDVPDLPATIAFYTQGLGFTLGARMDDERGRPFWCSLQRDGVEMMFTSHYHDEPGGDHDAHSAELTGSIYVNVDDVDALAEELRGRGVAMLGPPVDREHGMREFALKDPSGYVLLFGRPV